MDKRIEKARELDGQINQIKDFIGLIEHGQKCEEQYGNKPNNFNGISLSAKIWTGSDNPKYEQQISYDHNTIRDFVNAGKEKLKEILDYKKKELDSLFKD